MWRAVTVVLYGAIILNIVVNVVFSMRRLFYFSSADDPYMLYAAMHSGLNAYILSNDMMRDTRFLLGDKLMARFKLWQRLRQIRFRGVWPGDKWGMKSRFLVGLPAMAVCRMRRLVKFYCALIRKAEPVGQLLTFH